MFDRQGFSVHKAEVPINWFPGHMNKARRELKKRAAQADAVLEILDARLPASSRNPLLDKLCAGLPRLRILTKPDLADPDITNQWVEALSKPDCRVMPLQVTQPNAAKVVVKACRDLVPKRGRPGFPVRVMIVGVPNVGKSTLFNALVGKKKALVGDKPAVTRQTQQIDVEGGVSLLDTPGVLWPKFTDEIVAYRLAASGAIRDAVIDPQDVAEFALRFLIERYPEPLAQRYDLSPLPREANDVLVAVCKRRGCLVKGGEPDLTKGGELVLRELRAGLIGRVSLETPADWAGRLIDDEPLDDGESETESTASEFGDDS
jgi:ribosome biogenesis GTPase A